MSSHRTILQISEALQSLIWQAIEADPELNGLISEQKAIDFHSPAHPNHSQQNGISLWLYEIADKTHLQTGPAGFGSQSIAKTPSRVVDLSYLITPMVDDASGAANLLILGKILVLMQSNRSYTAPTLSFPLRIGIQAQPLETALKLWSALGKPVQTSLILQISSINLADDGVSQPVATNL